MINCTNPRPVIKAAKLWVVLLFCLTTPMNVLAESAVQGTVVNAPARIEKSTNIAAGSDNKAEQSSVVLKNVKMSTAVVNSVQSETAVNVAAGKRNVARQGSVSISRGTGRGVVLNSVATKSTSNMAAGSDNQANQSSVAVTASTVKGTVSNTSKGKNMLNAAVGSRNQANQAAIVMDGTQLRGIAVNKATGENAINAAVGYRNAANQSSIVVDGGQAGDGSAVTMPQNTFQADSVSTGQGEPSALAYTGRKRVQESNGQRTAQHVPGQVVFLVDNDKAGLAGLDRIAKKYHLDVGEKTVLKSLNRIMVVSSTAGNAAEIALNLKNESGVYNPQPNYIFATMGGKDPLSPMQNLVSMLDLPEVHGKVSGKNITVAVVDTGVEVEHEDLRSRIIGYQNFISGSSYQGEIHGTAVAGIIGAGQNEYGIVGIAPDVSLLALRGCRQVTKISAMGECFSTSLVRSLDAAITAKADVVNLSLGAYVDDTLLGMMIDSGHEKGIVFAAPVGNDPAAENIAFPASHDKVISVAGLDESGNPLPNRRLASMADAVAPATHLFVTTPGSNYNFSDGTSLASASISGIIALSMEKKTARHSPCLPRFNSAVPWPKQVLSCIGL
ncbi:MAG: Peptidase S8 and S53 subtilisin kexin sedolisin [uncultured bacterium]|nr:MAG: Peptidase S8 and S53 subtilisin kexin sedolisin [uncultured bacterium]